MSAVDNEAWLSQIPAEHRMDPIEVHGAELLGVLTLCDKVCPVCDTFIHTLNRDYFAKLYAICGTCGHVLEMVNKWSWH